MRTWVRGVLWLSSQNHAQFGVETTLLRQGTTQWQPGLCSGNGNVTGPSLGSLAVTSSPLEQEGNRGRLLGCSLCESAICDGWDLVVTQLFGVTHAPVSIVT